MEDPAPFAGAGDVVGGFVSVDSAREDYGVVIDEHGAIDVAATAARRGAPRGAVRMFHRNGYFGPLVDRTRRAL